MFKRIQNIIKRARGKKKKLVSQKEFLDIVRVPMKELRRWYSNNFVIFSIDLRKQFDEEEIFEVVYMLALQGAFFKSRLKKFAGFMKIYGLDFVDIYGNVYKNHLVAMKNSESGEISGYIKNNIINVFKDNFKAFRKINEYGSFVSYKELEKGFNEDPGDSKYINEQKFYEAHKRDGISCPFCGMSFDYLDVVHYFPPASPELRNYKPVCAGHGRWWYVICKKCRLIVYKE